MTGSEQQNMLSGLEPLGKYTLRKTGECVEIIACNISERGARSDSDWVSYIDSQGIEHIKEPLNIQFDFKLIGVVEHFEKYLDTMTSSNHPIEIPKLDEWEYRRFELVKALIIKKDFPSDDAILFADNVIEKLKQNANSK